jgi:hypothetical protein
LFVPHIEPVKDEEGEEEEQVLTQDAFTSEERGKAKAVNVISLKYSKQRRIGSLQ